MKRSKTLLSSLILMTACGNSVSSGTPVPEQARLIAGQPTPGEVPEVIPTPGPDAPQVIEPLACGAQRLRFEINRTIVRSTLGLTQGFLFEGGSLFESTGYISGHGPSVLNLIDPVSGLVTQLFTTPSSAFGEGLVKLGNVFYQLTYTEGKVFQYATDGTRAGTRLIKTFSNPLSEGWGLTTDGTDLIASDGSSTIYRLDPVTLQIKSQFRVTNSSGRTISGINELEYVNGQIYANQFPTDRMIRFDAKTGCQTGEVDLSSLPTQFNCSLYPYSCTRDSVTNGVAFDPSSGNFYLTGKSWPSIFEGKFE